MKRIVLAGAAILALTGPVIWAHEIDGRVLNHYTYFGGGYGYLHDIEGIDAHGVYGDLSFEEHDVVVTFGGGHFWGEDNVNLWSVGTSLGYVLRLAENHLNIIPRFGGLYTDVSNVDGDAGLFRNESWSITPGGTLSYALNNRFGLAASYFFIYNLDDNQGDHVIAAGPRLAIFERVGVSLNGLFSDEEGFTGATLGVEFHY